MLTAAGCEPSYPDLHNKTTDQRRTKLVCAGAKLLFLKCFNGIAALPQIIIIQSQKKNRCYEHPKPVAKVWIT